MPDFASSCESRQWPAGGRVGRNDVLIASGGALGEDIRVEKARAGQVIDARPIEEPAVATDVRLLVPQAAPAREAVLSGRKQVPGQEGFVFQPVLVHVDGLQQTGRSQRGPSGPGPPSSSKRLGDAGQAEQQTAAPGSAR